MRDIVKGADSARMRLMLSGLIVKYMSGLKNVSVSADINPQSL